ncbi:MAG: DUF1353 domain-containing protein [Victivallaceae bacterium]|nr:DUF1353 domain-containing protein [Victivallaceae bacterium]
MTANHNYDIEGQVAIEFILCQNRRQCDTCPLEGDNCRRERREVRLLEDVIYILPGDRRILIRKGFVFDGASIPRFFWRTVGHPLDHEFIRAVLLHDGVYAAELLPRKDGDWAFLEFMRYYDDIGWIKRNAMYEAVHCFGGSVWANHTPESISNAREYVSFI